MATNIKLHVHSGLSNSRCSHLLLQVVLLNLLARVQVPGVESWVVSEGVVLGQLKLFPDILGQPEHFSQLSGGGDHSLGRQLGGQVETSYVHHLG